MKQFLLKTCLMLVCLLVGAGTTWADSITKSISDVVTENSYTVSSGTTINTKCTSIDLDANINVTVNVKDGATGNTGTFWGTSPNIDWRLYQGDEPTITVTASTGYTISTVKFTYSNSNTGVINTSGHGQSIASGYQIISGTGYEVNAASATYYVGNTSTKTNGQARITAIEVVYTDGSTPEPTKYTVSIANNIANGSVTASPTSATAGTSITLTATPADGYNFGSWNVTGATVANATLAKTTFTMPESDVTVSATFEKVQTVDPGEGSNTGTIVFGTNKVKIDKANATGTDNLGNVWTITTEGTTSFTANEAYYQVGSSKAPATSITFTTTLLDNVTVTSFSAKFGGFSGTEGNVNLKIGDNTVGTGSLNATNDVTIASTSTAEGKVLTVTVTGIAKGVKAYNITYSYVTDGGGDDGGGTIEPPVTDPVIENFINTSEVTLELGESGASANVRQYLNLPEAYKNKPYSITTKINGEGTGEGFACVYDNVSFTKAGTYTVTVTAAAIEGEYAETTGTIKFIVTEPVVVPVYESLAALVAASEPTTEGTNVTVTLTDEEIKSIYVTAQGYRNGIFLKAGDREIEIFSHDVPEEWIVGGTVSGTLVNCVWKKYKETWELCPTDWSELTYTAPAVVYNINLDEEVTGGTIETSAETATEGTTITLKATPADGYKFGEWYVLDGEANEITVTDNKFTMPASDVEVSAIFELIPTYTFTWSINGKTKETSVKEGAAVVAPTVDDIDGHKFMGWTNAAIEGTQDEAPEYVTLGTASTDATYYAVFATASGSGDGEASYEELTNEEIVSLSEKAKLAYTTVTEYTDGTIDYTMQVYTDQPKRPWIQMKKDAGAYIKITAPSAITKVDVIITASSNTSGGVTDITKHIGFKGILALTENDCTYSAETSESVVFTDDFTDNKATLVPGGNYTTLYLKANGGVRIWGMTVYYGAAATYTDHCTLIGEAPASAEHTLTLVAQDTNGDYYGTFSSDKDVIFLASQLAEVQTVFTDGSEVLNEAISDESWAMVNGVEATDSYGYYVPANTGVLICSGDATVTYYDVTEYEYNLNDSDFSDNMLIASSVPMTGDNYFYKLAYGNYEAKSGLGFYWGADNGAAFTCKPGTAYLAVPTSAASNLRGFVLGGDTLTGIKDAAINGQNTEIFNLQGQRISRLQQGVNIVNGKKVIR